MGPATGGAATRKLLVKWITPCSHRHRDWPVPPLPPQQQLRVLLDELPKTSHLAGN